jgi:RHS repeat-associated protein
LVLQRLVDRVTGFDNNGNLLSDATHTYSWDAENKLTAVDSVNVTFDALGRMVEQARGSSYTQILYSPTGYKLALTSGQALQKAFCPLPGGATAVYGSSGTIAYYRHAEWLDSSRFASTPTRTKYFDVAYAPYGEDYANSGTADLDFTGQNQDTVSGLYDFLYREYHSNSGRWIQPDPAGLAAPNPANPQSWNRYAYISNMPLNGTDSLGLLGPKGDAVSGGGICIEGPACGWGGTYGSVTYQLNGIVVSRAVGENMLRMDAAVVCGSKCDDILSGKQTVGADGGVYAWVPGPRPGNCYPYDALGSGAECTFPGGPWTLKKIGTVAPIDNSYSRGAVAANNGQQPTWKQKNQDCLNKFNEAPEAKYFYNFLSPLSMIRGIGPEWKSSIAEDVVGSAAKYGVFKFFQAASTNWAGTGLGAMGGLVADTMHVGASFVTKTLVPAAAVGQLTGHAGCAISAAF